jgi:hypothetical protein
MAGSWRKSPATTTDDDARPAAYAAIGSMSIDASSTTTTSHARSGNPPSQV